jgi:FtsH-binding integral membrane protein
MQTMTARDSIVPGAAKAICTEEGSARMAFIRKVYAHFFLSLLTTAIVGCICVMPGILIYSYRALGFTFFAEIIAALFLVWGQGKRGLNLILLHVYSAIQGALVGPVLVFLEGRIPGISVQIVILSVAVFTVLSAYVMRTKSDFNWLSGILPAGLVAVCVGIVTLCFMHSTLLSLLVSTTGVILFACFILYDTSIIMTRLSADQFVTGAIDLYVDFIGLFWFILRWVVRLRT